LLIELEIVRAEYKYEALHLQFSSASCRFLPLWQKQCHQPVCQTLSSYFSCHVKEQVSQQCKRPLAFRRDLLHTLSGLSHNVKIGGFFENRQLFKDIPEAVIVKR